MAKKYRIERRRHSLIKPIVYLVLQLLALWELFWVLTGSANFLTWDYLEIAVLTLFILYLAKRTYWVLGRMKHAKSPWFDQMEMERFKRANP